MRYKIVAIRDRAIDTFGVPVFVASTGAAIRSFSDEVNRKDDNNNLSKHPEDFDLFLLGEYDDQTDEGLMVHTGLLNFALKISGCKKAFVFGDAKQIPFINRVMNFDYPKELRTLIVDNVERRYVTHRCPRDVTSFLNTIYKAAVATTSLVVHSVKGKKKRVKAESDWREYFSSSEEIQKMVAEGEHFSREILHICESKGVANYLEAREQMDARVLEYPDRWFNRIINCRVHSTHVKSLL